MARNKVTGRENEQDAAEAWLREHDPEYRERKRGWQTPSTDAMARDREEDPAFSDIHPIAGGGEGHYGKFLHNVSERGRKFENELLRRTPDALDEGDCDDG